MIRSLVGRKIRKALKNKKGIKMKRVGHLYETFLSSDNIKLAIKRASKGKKDRKVVEYCKTHADEIVKEIQDNPHISGIYKNKIVVDSSSGKKRNVMEPKFFPDQIIHHALCLAINPVLRKSEYYWSCGAIEKKGGLLASKKVRAALSKNNKLRYYVKLDIIHYYESVDHEILKVQLARKIKDKKILDLCSEIIDSVPQGLPIGNYTSQCFANFYLTVADHYIKEVLKMNTHIRYMDDMVWVDTNKRKLKKAVKQFENWIGEILHLKLHIERVKILSISRNDDDIRGSSPIDFVGYKHYRRHTTIRKRIFKRIRRLLIRMRYMINSGRWQRLMSYLGYLKYSDSKYIRKKYGLIDILTKGGMKDEKIQWCYS